MWLKIRLTMVIVTYNNDAYKNIACGSVNRSVSVYRN